MITVQKHSITLDLTPTEFKWNDTIKLKQFDNITQQLEITLKNNNSNYTPSSSSVMAMRMRKPDGHIIWDSATTSGNGKIYVNLTGQALAAAGRAYVDLMEMDITTNQIKSTAPFIIQIIPSPTMSDQKIKSMDSIDIFTTFYNSIQAIYQRGETLISNITANYNIDSGFLTISTSYEQEV